VAKAIFIFKNLHRRTVAYIAHAFPKYWLKPLGTRPVLISLHSFVKIVLYCDLVIRVNVCSYVITGIVAGCLEFLKLGKSIIRL
jgi:hypothetical protein